VRADELARESGSDVKEPEARLDPYHPDLDNVPPEQAGQQLDAGRQRIACL
jgi:hypothetical protein